MVEQQETMKNPFLPCDTGMAGFGGPGRTWWPWQDLVALPR